MLSSIAGLDQDIERGICGDLSPETIGDILQEAAGLAEERVAPLNRSSDLSGAKFDKGEVRTRKVGPRFTRLAAGWME
jgi:hypothetical protein